MLHDDTLDNIFMVQFYNIALFFLSNICMPSKLNIIKWRRWNSSTGVLFTQLLLFYFTYFLSILFKLVLDGLIMHFEEGGKTYKWRGCTWKICLFTCNTLINMLTSDAPSLMRHVKYRDSNRIAFCVSLKIISYIPVYHLPVGKIYRKRMSSINHRYTL